MRTALPPWLLASSVVLAASIRGGVAAAIAPPSSQTAPIVAITSVPAVTPHLPAIAPPSASPTATDGITRTPQPVSAAAPVALTPQAAIAVTDPVTSANPVLAVDPLLDDSANESPMDQVTSTAQLSDVKPTDWAFQALQSLVERYGCIVGYPDRTFRGNRALSRYEFAAGVNACLDRINELIAAGTANLVRKEDLATVQRLQNEYATELATIRGRVDGLEARTATLEKQQFSTTIKLVGQLITAVSDTFGNSVGRNSDTTQTYLSDRARLNLEGSFSGRDFLRVRLEFGNFLSAGSVSAISAASGTGETRLNFDTDVGNQLTIPHILYRFPVGDAVSVTIGPTGVGFTDITDTLTPPTVADDGMGIPSLFGEYSPFYRQGGGGAAINWNITKDIVLTLGYLASNAELPTAKNGLFNGGYNAMAQLAFYGSWGAIGLSYAHSYAPSTRAGLSGGAGSVLANKPFGDAVPTVGDHVAISGFYRVSSNFNIHAWGGYINAHAQSSGLSDIANGLGGFTNQLVGNDSNADIFYGAVGLTFPDVGGKGNMPGILVGIPPKVTSSDVRRDRDTTYHIEAFYRWQVTDNIGITPGFWVIINPEGNSRNDTQFVGVLRTYFAF